MRIQLLHSYFREFYTRTYLNICMVHSANVNSAVSPPQHYLILWSSVESLASIILKAYLSRHAVYLHLMFLSACIGQLKYYTRLKFLMAIFPSCSPSLRLFFLLLLLLVVQTLNGTVLASAATRLNHSYSTVFPSLPVCSNTSKCGDVSFIDKRQCFLTRSFNSGSNLGVCGVL